MAQRNERAPQLSWPPHLSPGAVRVSWSSAHYDDVVAFYRDLVGLPLIEQFTASFDEDGTIFGLPGLRTHLEIVRARDGLRRVDPLDQLVFYLSGHQAVLAATGPLLAAGVPTDPSMHPYWAANGAAVHLDPDGRRVVFAPWVYGDEPDPADLHATP